MKSLYQFEIKQSELKKSTLNKPNTRKIQNLQKTLQHNQIYLSKSPLLTQKDSIDYYVSPYKNKLSQPITHKCEHLSPDNIQSVSSEKNLAKQCKLLIKQNSDKLIRKKNIQNPDLQIFSFKKKIKNKNTNSIDLLNQHTCMSLSPKNNIFGENSIKDFINIIKTSFIRFKKRHNQIIKSFPC